MNQKTLDFIDSYKTLDNKKRETIIEIIELDFQMFLLYKTCVHILCKCLLQMEHDTRSQYCIRKHMNIVVCCLPLVNNSTIASKYMDCIFLKEEEYF